MRGRTLVAYNLRRIRTAKGISQERLAADSGVDRAYVSQIETEKFAVTVDVLDRLADVLGCTIAEFLAGVDAGSQPPAPLPRGRRPKL